jgi:tRNA threonylcarbamoyladenosine biosynthesis protein TsaB
MSPALLAFECSTDRSYVGLAVGAREWHEDGASGASASATLIGRVMSLLKVAQTSLQRLDAIAFGRGPGAFTGLRTACAVAQGLALGSSKPVLALDTLMVWAEDARARSGATDLWVAVDARMDEIYAARYVHGKEGWRTVVAPCLYASQALNALWHRQPPRVVAGNALPLFEGRLDLGRADVILDARPQPRALLACARDAWQRDEVVDAATARPSYVRDRVAATTAEREATKASAGTA